MFDKLDAYNLVANLVPGAALIYALYFSGFPTPAPDDLGAFLLVAFVSGVMTNRIGSLFLDPFLRHPKIGFLKAKDYKAFVTSQKNDSKLDTIVANTGLYRTFVTAGILYLLLIVTDQFIERLAIREQWVFVTFVVVGIGISALALRKEDGYIKDRIEAQSTKGA